MHYKFKIFSVKENLPFGQRLKADFAQTSTAEGRRVNMQITANFEIKKLDIISYAIKKILRIFLILRMRRKEASEGSII